MAEVKFKEAERMSRADAAVRLSEVANALRSGRFELERDGEKRELEVADEVWLELEVEVEDNETGLKVEVKWSSASPSPAEDRFRQNLLGT